MSLVKTANTETIALASNFLQKGDLVIFPTETVYGIGADATNGDAVEKIYAAKKRPNFNPLISHFAHVSDIDAHAEINKAARLIMSEFMPGPITLILARKENSLISDIVTAGLTTIAVRVPDHKVARELISLAGAPIAAPSANISGRLSVTAPAHLEKDLINCAAITLMDGRTKTGLESTILDCSTGTPVILRAGAVTADMISDLLGMRVEVSLTPKENDIKSPGQLLRHYAPQSTLRLNALIPEKGEAFLGFGPMTFITHDGPLLNLSENGDVVEAAANLFDYLNQLDKENCPTIAIMPIPNKDIGIAINERLSRAAHV